MTRNVFLAADLAKTLTAPAMADGRSLANPDIAKAVHRRSDFDDQSFVCKGGTASPSASLCGHGFAISIADEVTFQPRGDCAHAVQPTNQCRAKGFGSACPPFGKVEFHQGTVHMLGATLVT